MPSWLPGRSTHCVRRVLAEGRRHSPMDDPYAQLVRDALDVLDRYRAPIDKRDPARSLNENHEELLGRVRVALERLICHGPGGRDDVVEILRRIDEMDVGVH
jgi:hypothetical protein